MNQWILTKILIIIIHHMVHVADFAMLTIPYHYSDSGNEIPIICGLNSRITYAKLDLTNEQTWLALGNIADYKFNSTIILNEDVEFVVDDQLYQGKRIKDTINVLENCSILFEFNIVIKENQSYSSPFRGALGFPFTYTDTNHSLLHLFKEKGLIDYLSFSTNSYGHKLYLGEAPEEASKGMNYSYCNVVGTNSSWNCNIKGVKLATKAREYHYPMAPNLITFTADRNVNYVPKAFFDFIATEFYDIRVGNVDHNYCISNYKKKRQIYARENARQYGNITFMIENFAYTVEIDAFWDCYEFGCDLNLFENLNGDYWIIGHSFYHLYHTVFDYEKRRVEFYSSKGVEMYKDNDIAVLDCSVIRGVIYVNMSILFIGLGFVLSKKLKLKA